MSAKTYNWLLIAAVLLCFGSLIGSVVLAGLWMQPTDEQKHIFDGLDWCFKTTVGAMLGLVGGKVTT